MEIYCTHPSVRSVAAAAIARAILLLSWLAMYQEGMKQVSGLWANHRLRQTEPTAATPPLACSICLQCCHYFYVRDSNKALTVVFHCQVVVVCGLIPHQMPAGQHCTCQHHPPANQLLLAAAEAAGAVLTVLCCVLINHLFCCLHRALHDHCTPRQGPMHCCRATCCCLMCTSNLAGTASCTHSDQRRVVLQGNDAIKCSDNGSRTPDSR